MLAAVLLTYAAFGAILLVPMLRIALRFGEQRIIVVDLTVYGLVLAAVLARRVARPARAWLVLLLTLALGLFFSWGWGGNSGGPLWLISAPVMAGILLGVSAAVTMLGLVMASAIGIGVMAANGLLPWTQSVSATLPPADGVVIWFVIAANLIFLSLVGALGSAVLARGLARQGEAQRRAEDELIVIGRALEQSERVILLVEQDGTVGYRNRAESASANVPAVALDRLKPVGEYAPAVLPWRDAFRDEAWAGRCDCTDADETIRHFDVSITPVKDAHGAVGRALIVMRDVSDRHLLEERLRTSAKLEAVGTLVGGIAHDFNNLLQPIMASAEEIRQQLPSDHPATGRLNDIESSALRGRSLVRRILTFSRDVELPRVPTSLADVCDEAVRLTETLRTAETTLSLDLDRRAWVLADPAELHHVLANLISNACGAMPLGGELHIATRREGDTAILQVRDSGIGMDDATQRRMFVPFFSTKGPGGGSGLGLSTVHGTVTALGGTVDVQSAPARGTTMIIRLPAIAPPSAAPEFPAPLAPAAAGGSHTVLVVDDDDAVRRAITRMLGREGYQVIERADPMAAVTLLEDPRVDLVLLLTDLSMPKMTGVALAARARALRPDLPVVLMTGIVDSADAEAARAEGVTLVVQKPFSREELRRALQAATHA